MGSLVAPELSWLSDETPTAPWRWSKSGGACGQLSVLLSSSGSSSARTYVQQTEISTGPRHLGPIFSLKTFTNPVCHSKSFSEKYFQITYLFCFEQAYRFVSNNLALYMCDWKVLYGLFIKAASFKFVVKHYKCCSNKNWNIFKLKCEYKSYRHMKNWERKKQKMYLTFPSR